MQREIKGKTSTQRRYCISSLSMTAERAMNVIRSHWRIENDFPSVMYVTFIEDGCTVSTGNAAENFALFRVLKRSS